jgi:hypothetical protein
LAASCIAAAADFPHVLVGYMRLYGARSMLVWSKQASFQQFEAHVHTYSWRPATSDMPLHVCAICLDAREQFV